LLGRLGSLDEAISAKEEAIDLYRGLAQRRPAGFMPVLAGSLSTLADLLEEAGRLDSATAVDKQAITALSPQFIERSQAFSEQMMILVRNYLRRCAIQELEADDELLRPIRRVLESTQKKADDDREPSES
jgi:hypothetical protein